MNQQTITVSELNAHIKGLLDSDTLLGGLAVRGELSNYKVYPSGHHYFTLKDAESSLRCVMFRSHAARLRFRPESGMSVTAIGSVSVYTRDGAYQLYCTGLVPTGLGDLYAAYEQLKERLAKAGLFDPAHKKLIPLFPSRIAVITSSAGAAVRDVIRVLSKRWPAAEVVLLPVRVQGVEAPAEIAGAIRYANRWKVADLIITGRGGGSIEDLWAFNDERVAHAIFESEIPVISAVGHEPDVTISDFVADVRAATPSNAAELAVPDQNEVRDQLQNYRVRMMHAAARSISERRNRLADLSGRKVLTEPDAYLSLKQMELDRLQERIIAAGERWLYERKQQFGHMAAAMDAMSPLKVLARGYAFASGSDGSLIRSVSHVQIGDEISLRVTDGSIRCAVRKITEERSDNHGE